MPLRCTRKISFLPWMSGLSTVICLSNLPGRVRAWSRMSALLVPARTTTPDDSVKPSISTRSWLRVFSLSSLPPEKPPFPLCLPTASISSMKTMLGALALASLNRSLTREGPTPTNISMKSDPEMLKKGTDASPATALARSVLPVPGGPQRRAPLGILAPSLEKRVASWRKSTNSMISFLASWQPATSLNVTLISSFLIFLALLFPILNTLPMPPPPPPPAAPLIIRNQAPTMRAVGASFMSSVPQDVSETYWTGTKSLGAMPISLWDSSSLRSKLSTLPIAK
mmetsp:Transcript_25468/g.50817  ORF Transcript_25468/g.50817 Transcript_25468/m.50817 type:complete len:283 (+) Transcript_25468:987-1835(+)